MCNCIEELNKSFKESTGDDKAALSCGYSLKGAAKVGEAQALLQYPAMEARYRPKKKDGTFGNEKKISVRGEYCPFCGEKYVEEESLVALETEEETNKPLNVINEFLSYANQQWGIDSDASVRIREANMDLQKLIVIASAIGDKAYNNGIQHAKEEEQRRKEICEEMGD